MLKSTPLKKHIDEVRVKIPMGVMLLGFGITLLTLNERRNLRMKGLMERSHAQCRTVSASAEPGTDQQLEEGAIIHTSGFLRAEGAPSDASLAVYPLGALRLSRNTKMYQWIEHSHEQVRKDEKGNEIREVVYTYSQDWSASHQTGHSEAHSNPPFPPALPGGCFVFEADRLRLGRFGFQLHVDLRNKLNDFQPLPLTPQVVRLKECQVPAATLSPDLIYVANGGGSVYNPRLGDLKVNYSFVAEGDHTVVSGWRSLADGPDASGVLVPYTDEQSSSGRLADEGAVTAPDAAKDLVGQVGYQTFIIPEWIIRGVEGFLLSAAPICIAFIRRGTIDKEQAFNEVREDEHSTTEIFRFFGSGVCIIGSCVLFSILQILSSKVSGTAGFTTGALIAAQSIRQARAQIDAPPEESSIIGLLNGLATDPIEFLTSLSGVSNPTPSPEDKKP